MFHFLSIPNNVEYKEKNYNRIRGEDRWIGRKVKKHFEGFGIFNGIIDAADEDEDVNGHRIFHITYVDGDDEWVAVDELVTILQRPDEDSATVGSRKCVLMCVYRLYYTHFFNFF